MHLTGWTRWIASLVAVLVLWGGASALSSAKKSGVADRRHALRREGDPPLEGPNNDVILIWRELQRRGFKSADMTVLADNLPARNDVPKAAAQPTRAAILDALKDARRQGAGPATLWCFSFPVTARRSR